MRFKLDRSFYIPKGSVKVGDKLSDAVAYLSTSAHSGKPCAAIFFGKQAKPVANFVYRNEDERAKSVTRYFENRRSQDARRAAERAERKAFQHKAQIGDIYRTCWGYDQTNVEFFEIVEIRGKFAILREVEQASVSNGSGQDRCVPQSGAYLKPRYEGDDRGQPIRRLIQDGRIKIDDVRTAWPWGQRVAGAVVGEPVYQTSSGWGH